MDARKRNLEINILKENIEGKIDLNAAFTIEEIHDKLNFRNSDISNYLEVLFEEEENADEQYCLKEHIREKLNQYKQKHLRIAE